MALFPAGGITRAQNPALALSDTLDPVQACWEQDFSHDQYVWQAVVVQGHLCWPWVYRSRGSTQLSRKLRVYVLEMKLNSIQVRDVLVCIKQKTSDAWRRTSQNQSNLGKTTRAHGNMSGMVSAKF